MTAMRATGGRRARFRARRVRFRARRALLRDAGAFTILEVLVALVMLGIVAASVVGAFGVGLRSWKHSQEALDNLQRSSVVGDALLRCFQGIVFALENRDFYGLYGQDGSDGQYDTDTLSFVTRSHRLRGDVGRAWRGPRRITLFIDDSAWGQPALSMSVENPFVLESAAFPEPIPLTRYVRGLNFRYMDPMTGEWLDEWETPAAEGGDPEAPLLPGAIEVTITIANVREGRPDIVVTRVADLPIARTLLLDARNMTNPVRIRGYGDRRGTAGSRGDTTGGGARGAEGRGGRDAGRSDRGGEGRASGMGGRGSAAGGLRGIPADPRQSAPRSGGGRTIPVRVRGQG